MKNVVEKKNGVVISKAVEKEKVVATSKADENINEA
jgi:hypothetical protein